MTLLDTYATATIMDRVEIPEPIDPLLDKLRHRGGVVMVTGGLGSLGLAVGDLLDDAGIEHVLVDQREMDVTDAVQVKCAMAIFRPTTILHLAGAKHAPEGELDPLEPARVHIDGTRNILDWSPPGTRIVTASTCKSCDPETAYGATKLVAERLTLNAGQRVARFHNVVETSGNVFEIWAAHDDYPLDVAPCLRYFITLREALSALLYAATAPPGRYAISPGEAQDMRCVAGRLYPQRERRAIKPRRGDRIAEPLVAASETIEFVTDRMLRISSPHDPKAPA